MTMKVSSSGATTVVQQFLLSTPFGGTMERMINYETQGDPLKSGVYACRIPSEALPGLCEDKFLMWYQGKWGYLGSDLWYRGKVVGWLGPLPRVHELKEEPPQPPKTFMMGKVCERCGKGEYAETSIFDDWEGVLHCLRCGHETERRK